MQRIKLTVIVAMALLLTASWSVPLYAAENQNPFQVVLEDSLYGGLLGTVIGSATLAFTNHKSDHLDNIAYGAAIGVITGAGVGIFTNINRALVEYENGRLRLAVPKVMPDLQETSRGQYVLAVKADLLRGTF